MPPAPRMLAADVPGLKLAITKGLLRWWPNPIDGREEVSGTEGSLIGLLPPPGMASDDYAFNYRPGWLDAGPGITNESFTLALWLQSSPQTSVAFTLEQAEGLERAWSLRWLMSEGSYYVFEEGSDETDLRLQVSDLDESWVHIAVTRSSLGTKMIYKNGVVLGSVPSDRPYHPRAGTLSIGCNLAGDRQWRGNLHDVVLYDRILTSEEIRRLADHHQDRPPRDTECRRKATGRPLPSEQARMPDVWVEDVFQHRRYTSDSGLPGNEVKCVLQATDGHLWVGTSAGLGRFDGTRFLAFTPENTPAMRTTGPDMRSLAEDRDGTIWVGTFGGLLQVRAAGITVLTNALPGLLVMRVEPAKDGTLWLACLHNGDHLRGPCWVVRYDPMNQRVLSKTRAPNQVYEMRDSGQELWLATESELLRWNGRDALPELLLRHWLPQEHPTLASPSLPLNVSERVYSLNEPRVGPFVETLGTGFPGSACWTVDRLGLNRIGKRMGAVSEEWQGTRDGLFQKTADGWRRVLLGAAKYPHEVDCLTPNREGGVWFGTWDRDGLHLLTPKEARTFSLAQGLPDPAVSSISQAPDGSLVFATLNGYFGLGSTSITSTPPVISEASISLTNGLVLGLEVSSLPGPIHAVLGKKKCLLVLPIRRQLFRASGILRDRAGSIWVSTGNGILKLSPQIVEPVLAQLQRQSNDISGYSVSPNDMVYFPPGESGLPDLDYLGGYQTRDGTIWFGTRRGGLYKFQDGAFHPFEGNASLQGTEFVLRHEDAAGRLWIISTEGLYCNDHGRLTRFTTADGLRENLILDCAEDPHGNLWLPGATGVHRISAESLEKRLQGTADTLDVITLGARDGMISPQCSRLGWPRTLMTARGVFWVPTRNGAVAIDTRHVRTDSDAPQVVITEVLTAAGSLYSPAHGGKAPTTGLTLPLRSHELGNSVSGLQVPADGLRAIQFRFAALSFGNWEDRPLRYRLRGHDADWSTPAPVTSASYTALRPGTYTFEVQAANRYGRWTEAITRFPIKIEPHLYERSWFQTLLIVGLAAVIGWGIRHRIQNERRWARLREEQRLVTERARIARDMHDELGAGLTQLSLLQNEPEVSSARARQMLRVLDEIVWTINPRKDTLEATASYLTSWAEEFLSDSGISLELDIPLDTGETVVTSEWRHELLLCAKEALNNVVKHAQAKKVKLTLEVSRDKVALRISDNGKGIPASPPKVGERAGGGNGLQNLRERAAKLGGNFQIQSTPGQGTVVQLTLPLEMDTP